MRIFLLIFFPCFAFAQKKDTVSAVIVYADTSHRSTRGYYYVNWDGSYVYLNVLKQPLNPSYKVYFPLPPSNPVVVYSDTLVSGKGIRFDELSPHKFMISADSTKK